MSQELKETLENQVSLYNDLRSRGIVPDMNQVRVKGTRHGTMYACGPTTGEWLSNEPVKLSVKDISYKGISFTLAITADYPPAHYGAEWWDDWR